MFSQSGLARLSAAAILLLCAAQTLAIQHAHEHEAEPSCVVCTTAPHDDELAPAAGPEVSADANTAARLAELLTTPRVVFLPCLRARAPPAN